MLLFLYLEYVLEVAVFLLRCWHLCLWSTFDRETPPKCCSWNLKTSTFALSWQHLICATSGTMLFFEKCHVYTLKAQQAHTYEQCQTKITSTASFCHCDQSRSVESQFDLFWNSGSAALCQHLLLDLPTKHWHWAPNNRLARLCEYLVSVSRPNGDVEYPTFLPNFTDGNSAACENRSLCYPGRLMSLRWWLLYFVSIYFVFVTSRFLSFFQLNYNHHHV